MKLHAPLAILLVVSIAGCGDKPKAVVAPPAPSAEATPVAANEPLGVVNFSPLSTPAGVAFNVQADGNSGFWFELNKPVLAQVRGRFNGKPLKGVVAKGKIITATIPLDYIAEPGNYPIEFDVAGNILAAGTFVVEGGTAAGQKNP